VFCNFFSQSSELVNIGVETDLTVYVNSDTDRAQDFAYRMPYYKPPDPNTRKVDKIDKCVYIIHEKQCYCSCLPFTSLLLTSVPDRKLIISDPDPVWIRILKLKIENFGSGSFCELVMVKKSFQFWLIIKHKWVEIFNFLNFSKDCV